MRLRRDRECSVCEWTGPRSEMLRCPGGFVCRDDSACQRRYRLVPWTSEALARRAARACARLGLNPAEVLGEDCPA